MKRKVIDDIVKSGTSPAILYSNQLFKDAKISETARVSDKREVVKLNSRRIPNQISLISNVETIYNTIAQNDNEGIITVTGKADIVVPINNIRILKAVAYCNVNPNQDYSCSLSEMFMYILKQTLNRTLASDDGLIVESGTALQRMIKKELMEFYISQCS